MWHLENFFDAVRNKNRKMLNCNGAEAFKTAVAVFGVNPAIESGNKLPFGSGDFSV